MQNNIFSTLFVGQNLIKLSEVDSTNNFLKLLVSNSEPLPEGTVIMADNQFAGRGQQGSVWHAEPGMNLTFSLYLKPAFLKITEQFFLNMLISITLHDTLVKFLGPSLKIKWPNDIYYNDQKMGGILIENTVAGNRYKSVIIGIGINVNQKKFDTKLLTSAISMFQILQQDVNLSALLGEICGNIESRYLKLRSGKYTNLRAEYISCLYKWNEPAYYRSKEQIIEGQILDVTDQGLLVVLTKGKKHLYNFKEIEFLNGK